MDSDDVNRIKAVIDLVYFTDKLAEDRPKLSIMLNKLGIDSTTMWNAVVQVAGAASVSQPHAAVELINQLFKAGVTIGYQYAKVMEMESKFNTGVE